MKLTTGFKLTERFALNLISAALSRYFTELITALGTYWEFEKSLEFQSGDTFEFEFLAPTAIVAATMYLTDGDADRGFVILGSTGSFIVNTVNIGVLEVDGVSVGLSSTYPVDGKLHTIKITWDDVAEIKYLGMRNIASSFYTGILADPVATISGQTQTWKLGNGVGDDTEYNAENTFGAETWDSINFSGAGTLPWTGSYGDTSGNFTVVGAGIGPRTISGTLIDGKTYIVRIHADVVGAISFWYFDGVDNREILSTAQLNAGVQEVVFTADSLAQLYLRNGSGTSSGVLHSISVEEVLGNAITRINVPDESVQKYTLIDDSWIGQELWTYGDYTYTGVEADFALLIGTSNSDNITLGGNYVSSWDFNVVGTARTRLRVAGNATYQTVSGTYAFEQVAANTQLYLQNDTNSNLATGTTASNVSVKRKIEVALQESVWEDSEVWVDNDVWNDI